MACDDMIRLSVGISACSAPQVPILKIERVVLWSFIVRVFEEYIHQGVKLIQHYVYIIRSNARTHHRQLLLSNVPCMSNEFAMMGGMGNPVKVFGDILYPPLVTSKNDGVRQQVFRGYIQVIYIALRSDEISSDSPMG